MQIQAHARTGKRGKKREGRREWRIGEELEKQQQQRMKTCTEKIVVRHKASGEGWVRR